MKGAHAMEPLVRRILITGFLLMVLGGLWGSGEESEVPKPIVVPPGREEAATVVKEVTETVTVDKSLYEKLLTDNKRLQEENRRLMTKRVQLIAECEQLATELAILRQRIIRALRCQTIQEAIEELQSYSGNNEEK